MQPNKAPIKKIRYMKKRDPHSRTTILDSYLGTSHNYVKAYEAMDIYEGRHNNRSPTNSRKSPTQLHRNGMAPHNLSVHIRQAIRRRKKLKSDSTLKDLSPPRKKLNSTVDRILHNYDPSDYRPVGLTNVPSKETRKMKIQKILYDQIISPKRQVFEELDEILSLPQALHDPRGPHSLPIQIDKAERSPRRLPPIPSDVLSPKIIKIGVKNFTMLSTKVLRRKSNKRGKNKPTCKSMEPTSGLLAMMKQRSEVLELTPWDESPGDSVQQYVNNLKLKNFDQ